MTVVSHQTRSMDLQVAQHAFLTSVTGETLGSDLLETACEWYLSFLESRIREAWAYLICPVVVDTNPFSDQPSSGDMAGTFRFLTAMVSEFRREELALVQIVDTLYNSGILKETDDDRSHANQLVFAAFGWISELPQYSLVGNDCLLRN